MLDHLFFCTYIILFIHSTIGYGFIFARIVNKEFFHFNIGYIGIIGFFLISLISIFTSFFISHGFLHNSILHLIGITSFIIFFYKFKKIHELKLLWIVLLILWIGLYLYKNHDDFAYYHLTYSLNLSENSFAVGMGKFSHGFRTFSSLFYFHSVLYMPYIEFYLFHIGPFLILLFFNSVIISKLINVLNNRDINFVHFFSLLSLMFINIAFYRLAEHGTDRSAQILLILIFIIFFETLYIDKEREIISTKLSLLLILLFLASSMKAIYYLYLILLPIIFFKQKLIKIIARKKNFLIIFFVTMSFVLNLMVNYFNTGCFLYPAQKTCVVKQEWSLPENEIKRMSLHYEWWAKAGGGPNYTSEIEPEIYVKNFNWVKNWIDRHFFNKVSDTLLGIIFIGFLVLTIFKFSSTRQNNPRNKLDVFAFIIPLFFLLEWFWNHPSMRYGGYVLFAIPIFLFISTKIERYYLSQKKIKIIIYSLIILSLIIYDVRNLSRINKEAKIYKYNLKISPFFYVKNIKTKIVAENDIYKVFKPEENNKCWASKTPCSYNKEIKIGKFFWMNMVY